MAFLFQLVLIVIPALNHPSNHMSKRKTKPESFIRNPVYPGGKEALQEFIRTNLRYPEEALKHRVEGSVKVLYDVDVFGKVIEAKVAHRIGYGCDEEALRLVRMLEYPKKKYQGLHVVFHMNITIHFRMNPASAPPSGSQVKLNYVPTEKSSQEKKPSGGNTYSYSIPIDPDKN